MTPHVHHPDEAAIDQLVSEMAGLFYGAESRPDCAEALIEALMQEAEGVHGDLDVADLDGVYLIGAAAAVLRRAVDRRSVATARMALDLIKLYTNPEWEAVMPQWRGPIA